MRQLELKYDCFIVGRKIKEKRDRVNQRGYVLFFVMLLLILFTGLGMIALRHTRMELRSSQAFANSDRAASMVEGAFAMAVYDLKQSSDYYRLKFYQLDKQAGDGPVPSRYLIPLNGALFPGEAVPSGICATEYGHDDTDVSDYTLQDVCVNSLSNQTANADGDFIDEYNAVSATVLTHGQPQRVPCRKGSEYHSQNFACYRFNLRVQAIYGEPRATTLDEIFNETNAADGRVYRAGRAEGRASVIVEQMGAFGK